MSIFLGVDPGASGGIAILNDEGLILDARKIPEHEADIIDHIRIWRRTCQNRSAMIERVSASPQMGVVSAFSFGRSYGMLRMALTAAGIPFDEVSPIKWQNAMDCRTGGDKNVSKRKAQELFPTHKLNHYIADALLLAEYGRRVVRGLPLAMPARRRAATPLLDASGH